MSDKRGSAHGHRAALAARAARSSIWSIWGSSNKQIAGRLGISIKTVETHRGHINGKLQVHTSADIVRLASLWGLFLAGPSPTANQVAGRACPAATERCRQ